MPSIPNMVLGQLLTIAALALINGLYLHHLGASQSLRVPGLPADILATADLTNDLFHYAQALHSAQSQHYIPAAEAPSFDEDYALVTIGHIDEYYQGIVNLKTSTDFSGCEPLFDKLWYYRPNGTSLNEEDGAALKTVIQKFVQDTAIETVERCIKSMRIAVQQHVYLRKLHAATSLWVRKIEEKDNVDRDIDGGGRSYKLTAGVTYLSIMLEVWTHETAGLWDFLVNLREMLWGEKARVAEDAAAGTGPFAEFKKALLALV
jgi:hypothetical protein